MALSPHLRFVSFAGRELPPVAQPAAVFAPAFVPAPPQAPSPCAADDDDFGRWLLAEAGMDPRIYRLPSLRRRVAACLRALRVDSTDAARDVILNDPARLPIAINALLIGVTEFFRDASVTADIRARVLPAFAEVAGPLRVLSAGCSSGQELYSIAMLLAGAGLLERSSLVGTDCRADAVAEARAGVYDDGAVESLPREVRDDYFERCDGGWRVIARIRERMDWKIADVASDVEAGPWDLVLWRNVAIYLNPDAAHRILARLVDALRPGGFLVLGKAERAPAGLTTVSRCIFRKPGSTHGTC